MRGILIASGAARARSDWLAKFFREHPGVAEVKAGKALESARKEGRCDDADFACETGAEKAVTLLARVIADELVVHRDFLLTGLGRLDVARALDATLEERGIPLERALLVVDTYPPSETWMQRNCLIAMHYKRKGILRMVSL